MAAFSHVYIERDALAYPLAREVLGKLPKARQALIGHYKDVFDRPRQNFRAQKDSQQLILAVKRPPYLYPLSPLCETYGHRQAFYATPVLNCPYDCDFCFLQGAYPSAHMVVFVNEGDFFTAARDHAEPFFLSVSYENDLMAMERLVPWTGRWLDFAETVPRMELEVRTRSAHTDIIRKRPPLPNVVLAWSLSPPEIAARYEKKAPGPAERIRAAREAIDSGWRVRLCFEPIIRIQDWEAVYGALVEDMLGQLPSEKIDSAVADVFRMGKGGFDTVFQKRDDTDLFAFRPAVLGDSVTYPEHRQMGDTIKRMLLAYLPEHKVYGGGW